MCVSSSSQPPRNDDQNAFSQRRFLVWYPRRADRLGNQVPASLLHDSLYNNRSVASLVIAVRGVSFAEDTDPRLFESQP